jgi:hypothetical protein
MENHHFEWENPLQMVICNSYVSLPKDNNDTNGDKDGMFYHCRPDRGAATAPSLGKEVGKSD